MENLNRRIISKLSELLLFLTRSRNDFETLANDVENNLLKTALINLSEDTCCYAEEIKSYLMCLGVRNTSIDCRETEDENYLEQQQPSSLNGHELFAICKQKEKNLTTAYGDLLSESMPFESLKQLIFYQLNALKHNFLNIKTLNTARFAVY